MFERGKIVLVPFPFTDLSTAKVRPALIVSESKHMDEDLVVAFISSKITKKKQSTDCLISPSDHDFEKTGLKAPSVIRCNKIATLDKKIILGEMGELSPSQQKTVNKALKLALGL